MANNSGYGNYWIFVLAILTTISYQVTSNFANDYGDGVKGTDDETRIGPQRALQSGMLSKYELKTGILISIAISVILSIILIYKAFGSDWLYLVLFMLLGLFSIWAAIKYTIGSSPYGYKGMGDIFVFIFFGLVSVLGSFFLYTKYISLIQFLPAISIGLLCVGVLNLNNLRDIESDGAHGKNTLVVKLGFEQGKKYHVLLLITAFIAFLSYTIITKTGYVALIYLCPFIFIGVHLSKVTRTKNPGSLDPELKKLALSTFFVALSFYLSINYFL